MAAHLGTSALVSPHHSELRKILHFLEVMPEAVYVGRMQIIPGSTTKSCCSCGVCLAGFHDLLFEAQNC